MGPTSILLSGRKNSPSPQQDQREFTSDASVMLLGEIIAGRLRAMIDTTLLERESKSQRLVDVVDGFLALAQTPQLDIATLDIGSGSLVSIRDIVQELTLVTGGRVSAQFGTLPDRPLEPTRIAKVEDRFTKTCWKPCVSLRQGLESTVHWYRAELNVRQKVTRLVLAKA